MTTTSTSRRALALIALMGVVVLAWPHSASASSTDATATSTCTSTAKTNPLTSAKAVALGAVEGITEFLPISSTGHLLITERILHLDFPKAADSCLKDAIDTFTVAVQIGAILAVLGIYRRRVVTMFEGIVGRSEEGRRSVIALAVAFVPAAIIGVALNKPIKNHLLSSWPVVGAWIVGGIVILAFVANQSRLRVTITSMADLGMRNALIIGVAQAVSLWPGVSRSLVTILAALLVGMSLSAAVEFSFLLGVVTLSAATVYELGKGGKDMVDQFGVATPLLATAVAALTAFLAVKFMIGWLNRHGLALFGWYRIILGVGVGIAIATKVI